MGQRDVELGTCRKRGYSPLFIWCICGLGSLLLDIVDHTQSAIRCGALTWECLFKYGKPLHWGLALGSGVVCLVLGAFVIGWDALNGN